MASVHNVHALFVLPPPLFSAFETMHVVIKYRNSRIFRVANISCDKFSC